ncbi:MAG TPA: hypothetical protein VN924_03850 [Bryobacteraceae bacterium]|nr:hypothetical protein [Bryobacteraceae bacterium]
MNPLHDLLSHIRPTRRIPEEFRPDVEGQTVEKFLTRVRGGWLFELVIRAAAQYYGIERDRYVVAEDIVEDVELRIKGLARVIARDPKDAVEIASLARQELDRRIQGGFLAQMAWNVFRDLWRKMKREQKRQGSAADAEKAAQGEWERKKRNQEAPIPDAERDERLRLVFGPGAASAPHEMAAFAWGPGRTPRALVEDLATLTLSQLADAWVQCFAEIEQRDRAEVESLFEGLKNKATSERLFEFWDPLKTIDGWVESVQAEIVRQGSASKKPLHMRVAYLYQQKLAYTTERIAAQLGLRRLDQLAADFAPLYAKRVRRDADDVRAEFQPLLAHANAAAKPLGYIYKPHDKVLDWQYNVRRRARAAESEQLKDGLRLIVSGGIEPWKVMAFLDCHCLRKTPHLIAEKYGFQPLTAMKDGLIADFAEKWGASPDYVRASLSALGRRLIEPRTPKNLEACASEDRDLTRELQHWSEEVLAIVRPKFARESGLRLFALRHRLPAAATGAEGAAA